MGKAKVKKPKPATAGEKMVLKYSAPFDFIVRGWNITIMGRRTSSPRAFARCVLTGEVFTATAEGHAADVLGVLAGFIDATKPELWRRATGERGTLAVCEDHAGRWWTVRPPSIAQDGVSP